MIREYTIHIDVDSPIVLADFYNIKLENFSLVQLEKFYINSFNRMLDLFDELNLKVTFFCVANEIVKTEKIKEIIKKAIDKGHFIANHTLNHPFGLSELDDTNIKNEIRMANNILRDEFNVNVKGFRTPGYSINTNVLNILEDEGIKYDSSSAWPIYHVIFKLLKLFRYSKMKIGYGETNLFFKKNPYFPNFKNWQISSKIDRNIVEYPLPSSFHFLPCYSNFHIGLPYFLIKNLINNTKTHKQLVYLVHAIEFIDLDEDYIPKEIISHPHISKSLNYKINKLKKIISYINSKRNYFNIENQL